MQTLLVVRHPQAVGNSSGLEHLRRWIGEKS